MMNYDPETFWKSRLSKYSHTGWADPVIYAYDQEERLSVISNYLDTLEFKEKRALDFGCGTGEFSALLIKKGFKVWATDPYVVPQIASDAFIYTENYENLEIPDNYLTLIITVTVLDHITDPESLNDIYQYFKRKLNSAGCLIMMEYALEKNAEQKNSDYQSFRTIEEWQDILKINRFIINNIIEVPHPQQAPSNGYLSYRKSLIVKMASYMTHVNNLRPFTASLLRRYARKLLKEHPASNYSAKESPLKLITCTPQ